MATQPLQPGPATPSRHWYASSPVCNRSYLLAGVRAGVIALALLAVLALIVVF
jgi:hypothetical protein